MQNNHTPGPYHVGQGKAAIIIYDAQGNAIADAKTFHGRHEAGQAEANARLLAAAPEMFALLYEVEEANENIDAVTLEQGMAWQNRMRAVLAKVQGGQEGSAVCT